MRRFVTLVRKAARQPGSRWRLLMEAAVCLLLARLALACIPFRHLSRFFTIPVKGAEVTGAERVRLRNEVRWAIDRTAAYLPGEMACFPRAIVAQTMLRRRRVATTLYYGATVQPGSGLTAHVWVQDGALGVVGQSVANEYETLGVYPSMR